MAIQWKEMQSHRRNPEMEKAAGKILKLIHSNTLSNAKKRKERHDKESEEIHTSVERVTKNIKLAVTEKYKPIPPPTAPPATIPVDRETKALLGILANKGNRTTLVVLTEERFRQREKARGPTQRTTSKAAQAAAKRGRKDECRADILRLLTPALGISIQKEKGKYTFTLMGSYKASFKAQHS